MELTKFHRLQELCWYKEKLSNFILHNVETEKPLNQCTTNLNGHTPGIRPKSKSLGNLV